MEETRKFSCIDCTVTACNKKKGVPEKSYPSFCPTPGLTLEELDGEKEIFESAMNEYDDEYVRKITKAAAEVEYENYCRHTRVEEVMDFARKIGAHKIGIATCAGLIRESRTLAGILRSHGFEVVGFCCKTGAVNKHEVGIPECCENIGFNMCNPILQAKMLNAEKTELNLVVGLCVGHDSLFYRYSDALVTTVVTKDRVLGNNPVQALYTAESYYKKLYNPD